MGFIKSVLGWAAKRILGLIIGAAIVGAAVFFLVKGLNQVSLQKFELTGITNIAADSFTLQGMLSVKNPSKIPIPIQSIEYEVVLKDRGERISSGTLPPFVLRPGSVTDIPFDQRIYWVPTAQLAAELATQDHVYAVVTGTVLIDLPEVGKHAIPFKAQVDIKQYIVKFLPADLSAPAVGGIMPGPEPASPPPSLTNPLGMVHGIV